LAIYADADADAAGDADADADSAAKAAYVGWLLAHCPLPTGQSICCFYNFNWSSVARAFLAISKTNIARKDLLRHA